MTKSVTTQTTNITSILNEVQNTGMQTQVIIPPDFNTNELTDMGRILGILSPGDTLSPENTLLSRLAEDRRLRRLNYSNNLDTITSSLDSAVENAVASRSGELFYTRTDAFTVQEALISITPPPPADIVLHGSLHRQEVVNLAAGLSDRLGSFYQEFVPFIPETVRQGELLNIPSLMSRINRRIEVIERDNFINPFVPNRTGMPSSYERTRIEDIITEHLTEFQTVIGEIPNLLYGFVFGMFTLGTGDNLFTYGINDFFSSILSYTPSMLTYLRTMIGGVVLRNLVHILVLEGRSRRDVIWAEYVDTINQVFIQAWYISTRIYNRIRAYLLSLYNDVTQNIITEGEQIVANNLEIIRNHDARIRDIGSHSFRVDSLGRRIFRFVWMLPITRSITRTTFGGVVLLGCGFLLRHRQILGRVFWEMPQQHP